MAEPGRRFTVLWTAQRRDKRSAVMTLPEAEKLAARLRIEKVEQVAIHEGLDGPLSGSAGKY
jgi:hypothetical protein